MLSQGGLQDGKLLCRRVRTPTRATAKSAVATDVAGQRGTPEARLAFNEGAMAAQAASKAPGGQQNGKRVYDEKVRGKAERAAMPAWDCPVCMEFFRALENQGRCMPRDAIKCADCAAGARQAFVGAEGTSVGDLRQAAGRHRAEQAAPATPKHFWGLGFE